MFKIAVNLIFFFLFIIPIKGQELNFLGHSGLIYTPSAYISDWGSLYVGMTHYPATTSFTFERGESTERSYWAHLGFLPFGEVSVRLTKPYNSSDKNYGIGDRSISFRLQLLKEKKKRPAILIGVNDPFSASSYFNTNYLVLSKTHQLKTIELNANIGYGIKIEDANGHILQGLFGGIQAKWKDWRLMLEHDTQYTNLGMGYQFKNRVFFNAAMIDFKYLSASLALRFMLRE
jgi:hypothetical protein